MSNSIRVKWCCFLKFGNGSTRLLVAKASILAADCCLKHTGMQANLKRRGCFARVTSKGFLAKFLEQR